MKAACPYCGHKLMFDFEGMDRVLKEKEKTKRHKMEVDKEREDRQLQYERDKESQRTKGKVGILLILVVIIAIGVFVISNNKSNATHIKNGDVQVPMANSDIKIDDTEYKSVENAFKDAGFNNIISEPIADLNVGIKVKQNTIATPVTIDGVEDFRKDQWVDPDATVRITYHITKMQEKKDKKQAEKEQKQQEKEQKKQDNEDKESVLDKVKNKLKRD